MKARKLAATQYDRLINELVLPNAIHEVPGVQATLRQASEAVRDALKP
jgi:hypothetical protein